jgi:hypothetical protein
MENDSNYKNESISEEKSILEQAENYFEEIKFLVESQNSDPCEESEDIWFSLLDQTRQNDERSYEAVPQTLNDKKDEKKDDPIAEPVNTDAVH